MKEKIINRGKDWWAFRKGMDNYILQTKNMRKKNGEAKSKAIPNNTTMAPHSPMKFGVMTRI